MQRTSKKQGLTIVGLGLSYSKKLAPEILSHLDQATHIYVKSTHEKILSQLPPWAKPIAPVIQPEDQRSDRYAQLASSLLEMEQVSYAVPGDPLLDEASTAIIMDLAHEQGVPISIIPNQSTLTWSLQTFNLSPGLGLQIIDATILCSYHYPPLEPHRPVLIIGLYHPNLIAPIQKVLSQVYALNTSTQALRGTTVETEPLSSINAAVTHLYIPAQTHQFGLTRFQETVAHLRAPDGCPWDKKQTHQTLRPYLLEEAYEVLATIDEGNLTDLADELGDLLLQIVLHAQLGSEADQFRMTDIISRIQQKMIRRHPHVFGDTQVNSIEDVRLNWDQIKAEEKAAKGDSPLVSSAMDGVQEVLPALMQALDISKRAVKQGFEWNDAQGVLRKLREEADEIAAAANPTEVEAEIGDFLFTAVNLARKMGVDAETALRECNYRFMRRFRRLEVLAKAQNLVLPEVDKATWFALWQQAKKDVAHLEKG